MSNFEKLSFKTRLISLMSVAAFIMMTIGMLTLNTLPRAEKALGSIYRDRLGSIYEISRIKDLMHENRAQVLYALQFRPGSETEPNHQLDVAVHLRSVEANIAEVSRIWTG